MRKRLYFLSGALGLLTGASAIAAETVTYSYDAKGRLVRVLRSGGPSNGVVTAYSSDPADNRQRVVTTGASW